MDTSKIKLMHVGYTSTQDGMDLFCSEASRQRGHDATGMHSTVICRL